MHAPVLSHSVLLEAFQGAGGVLGNARCWYREWLDLGWAELACFVAWAHREFAVLRAAHIAEGAPDTKAEVDQEYCAAQDEITEYDQVADGELR